MKIIEIKNFDEIKNEILRERAKSAQGGRARYFVVDCNGTESAFLCYEDWSDKYSNGFIYEIFVLQSFRKQGLGNFLLKHAESFSMPFSLGFIYRFYDYEIYSQNDDVTLIADGGLSAISVTLAASYKMESIDFKFTGYMYGQVGEHIEMVIKDSSNTEVNWGTEASFSLLYIPGLKIEYLGFGDFSINFGLSVFLSGYNEYGDRFLRGLKMKTITAGVTYSF